MQIDSLVAGIWPFACDGSALPCTNDIIIWPYIVGICIVAALVIIGAVVLRKK